MPTPADGPGLAPLPKNFLRACVLLLLREHPSHGYDMMERLVALGFDREDPGRLYRTLRVLEKESLVRSAWEPSSVGPARRIYELTRPGMVELHAAAGALGETAAVLDRFLSRYGEFASMAPDGSRRARAR